jgi:hypothetical protein
MRIALLDKSRCVSQTQSNSERGMVAKGSDTRNSWRLASDSFSTSTSGNSLTLRSSHRRYSKLCLPSRRSFAAASPTGSPAAKRAGQRRVGAGAHEAQLTRVIQRVQHHRRVSPSLPSSGSLRNAQLQDLWQHDCVCLLPCSPQSLRSVLHVKQSTS